MAEEQLKGLFPGFTLGRLRPLYIIHESAHTFSNISETFYCVATNRNNSKRDKLEKSMRASVICLPTMPTYKMGEMVKGM